MFLQSNKLKKIFKLLKLDKPLVIFDTETTGIAISTDKIVELAYVKIWNNGRIKKSNMIINPEIKITPEASSIHSIRDSDVKDKPKFRDVSQELWEVFYDCYYGGFNIMDFDLPILRREFIRVGMDFDYNFNQIIDSKQIYDYMFPRNLSSAYEYYCKKEFKHYHTALLDAEVAAEILAKQLEKYKVARKWEFINNIHQIDEDNSHDGTRKFYWLNGEAYFAFSKHKDKSLVSVVKEDPKFLEWILTAEFSKETKNIIRLALADKK